MPSWFQPVRLVEISEVSHFALEPVFDHNCLLLFFYSEQKQFFLFFFKEYFVADSPTNRCLLSGQSGPCSKCGLAYPKNMAAFTPNILSPKFLVSGSFDKT